MSESRIESLSPKQSLWAPRRIERWGVGLTAIGLVSAWYAPRSWMRWSSGTVSVLTGSVTGLIYTCRVGWGLLTDFADNVTTVADQLAARRRERLREADLDLACACLRKNQDSAEFRRLFTQLASLPKADRKIANWFDSIKAIDEEWRNRIETFKALATLFPEDQWDPVWVRALPGPQLRRSDKDLKRFVTEFKWTSTNPELFNELLPSGKLKWNSQECANNSEKWKNYYNFVFEWIKIFPAECQTFQHFSTALFPKQQGRPRFESDIELCSLIGLFPGKSRRPEDFDHLVGDGLRSNSLFLSSYLLLFAKSQRTPSKFDPIIGDDLMESDPFWDQWLALFPRKVIDNKDHFYEFAALRLAAWIQKNPKPDHLHPEGSAYEIVRAIGRHYSASLHDDKALMGIRKWALLCGWLSKNETEIEHRALLNGIVAYCTSKAAQEENNRSLKPLKKILIGENSASNPQ